MSTLIFLRRCQQVMPGNRTGRSPCHVKQKVDLEIRKKSLQFTCLLSSNRWPWAYISQPWNTGAKPVSVVRASVIKTPGASYTGVFYVLFLYAHKQRDLYLRRQGTPPCSRIGYKWNTLASFQWEFRLPEGSQSQAVSAFSLCEKVYKRTSSNQKGYDMASNQNEGDKWGHLHSVMTAWCGDAIQGTEQEGDRSLTIFGDSLSLVTLEIERALDFIFL